MELSQLKTQYQLERDDVRCQAADESRHCHRRKSGSLACSSSMLSPAHYLPQWWWACLGIPIPKNICSCLSLGKGPRLKDL